MVGHYIACHEKADKIIISMAKPTFQKLSVEQLQREFSYLELIPDPRRLYLMDAKIGWTSLELCLLQRQKGILVKTNRAIAELWQLSSVMIQVVTELADEYDRADEDREPVVLACSERRRNFDPHQFLVEENPPPIEGLAIQGLRDDIDLSLKKTLPYDQDAN